MRKTLTLGLLTAALLSACGQPNPAPTATLAPALHAQTVWAWALPDRVRAAATAAGVTNLQLTPTPDAGLLVNGRIEGRFFAVRFPAQWNNGTVIMAQGYDPRDGIDPQVDADPVLQDSSLGFLPAAYRDGQAVGHISFDKMRFAVDSGIKRIMQLKTLVDAIGSQRTYIVGGSMGGSIVMQLIQRYPQAFAGAASMCGVVSDWAFELRYATDIRALYNVFAAGSAYELPGTHDVEHSATGVTTQDILGVLIHLFTDAQLNPQGQAAQIINRVISSVPNVQMRPEITSFIFPLTAHILGADDFRTTAGAQFISNRTQVYHSPLLSTAQNAWLNATIQRYDADPGWQTVAARYAATGQHQVKLLTVQNTYDPLVPYEHEGRLRALTSAAGNLSRLVQQKVNPASVGIPNTTFNATNHCGYSRSQTDYVWKELRNWVESGIRPTDGLNLSTLPLPPF